MKEQKIVEITFEYKGDEKAKVRLANFLIDFILNSYAGKEGETEYGLQQ